MIRFLFGRPGSGKTYTVTQEIIRAATASDGEIPAHLYLLVPEQQAFSAERDLLVSLPSGAARRVSVLSFSRLCDILFDRYGGRIHGSINRAMKSLFMWENLRELKGILETYSPAASTDPSLCEKMLAAVEEMRMNGVTSTALEKASDGLEASSPLKTKLRDLALVMASYDGMIADIYGGDSADRLVRAAEQIEKHNFFKSSTVYVDSFTSFTAQEYTILRALIRSASNVTFTLACESRVPAEPQFESLKDTIRLITRICKDSGIPFEDICLSDTHRAAPAPLLTLERHLWDFGYVPPVLPDGEQEDISSLRRYVCPTPYEEATAAALHILELNRAGISYGEMAVTVRDTTLWEGILDAALEEQGIPYFISSRTDLNEKPAARLLLTALRCISRRWQAEDIMTLCKTGLLNVSAREVDYFAEYVDTWKLSGRRMTDTAWSMNPDGYTVEISPRGREILRAANAVREQVMIPLLSLEEKLRAAENVTDQCRALYGYLTDLSIREKLTESAETYLALGQAREAGEQVRLWSFLTETLATVASAMAEVEPLSSDELYTALSLVFVQTDIGSIPTRHDCVTIGSAATLRVDGIKAMLVLGLCEGEFPQAIRDDGLLTEQDKETLSELGIELDSRTARLSSDELLYVWRAFSKPSETLILSCSASTTDGKSRSPSAAFTRVGYLFPGSEATRLSSAVLGHGVSLRHRSPMEDRVSPITARRLLGDEIWLSQSRLQTYARCPYSYYGAHILRLREKGEAKFDNLGAGVFLHHVMEQYLRLALDESNRIRPMDDDEVMEIADAVITAYMTDLCGDISEQGRLLHLFDRLRQVALALIASIQAELRQSAFHVAGLEWDTHGRRPGDPKPMILTLEPHCDASPDNGDDLFALPIMSEQQKHTTAGDAVRLLLGGRIDRVDIYRGQDGETVYVRVVDYKSSRHEFTTASITEDMNIQLLLYLFTLCSPENRALFADEQGNIPKRVLPASAVYLSPDETDRGGAILPCRTGVILEEPEILNATESDEDLTYLPSVKRNRSGELTGKGLCSAEQLHELEQLLRSAVRDTAAAMYDGCASRTPSDQACAYCRVRESCSARKG